MSTLWKTWRSRARAVGMTSCLAVSVWASRAAADELPPPAAPVTPPPVVAPAPTVQVLDLVTARHLAIDKQPTLAAYRASLAAAEAKLTALNNLGAIAGLASPDLPIRRCQATLGVEIAQAQLRQAEAETIEAVTRLYWTAVYAEAQVRLLDQTLKDLNEYINRPTAVEWVKSRFQIFIEVVSGRRATAVEGRRRALAALREAVGLCPEACLEVADHELPVVNVTLCKGDVIAAALSHRPEIVQATDAAQVCYHEIDAQAKTHALSAQTFAAASDIHAKPVPLTQSDSSHYRPGAVAIEMPTLLPGKRADRIEQARALAARADAVTDKTRGLVALEAENAFLTWQESATSFARLQAAADRARADEGVITEADKAAGGALRGERVRARELFTQVQADRNEAQYKLLLSLIALERITAGAVCPAPVVPAPAAHP